MGRDVDEVADAEIDVTSDADPLWPLVEGPVIVADGDRADELGAATIDSSIGTT